jgi:hypothetical protein
VLPFLLASAIAPGILVQGLFLLEMLLTGFLFFISGLWIRIGSGFNDFVDPDPRARKLRTISTFSVNIIYFYNGKV